MNKKFINQIINFFKKTNDNFKTYHLKNDGMNNKKK